MTKHIPVLLPEVIKYLDIEADDTVLDGTVGSGGYAKAITTSLGSKGTFVGIDADKQAIQTTRQVIKDFPGTMCLTVANFRTLASVLTDCEVEGLDGAVFDLGFRSEQLEAERGFSFQNEAPLTMTFQHPDDLTDSDLTAYDVVNQWKLDSLISILKGYGNERYAERIAEAIVEARKRQPLETTQQLAQVIQEAVPHHYKYGRRHPATRTFQAIRIAVNDEVNALKEGLEHAFAALNPQARLVVVSFHSIEDRAVKNFFTALKNDGRGEILTDSPVTPSSQEVNFNPRSRSSKLRAIEKCPTD